MRLWPMELIIGIWVVWFVFWRFAARGVKPALQQESLGSRLSYLLPMLIVIVLMMWQDWPGWLGAQLFDGGWTDYWISVALIVMGLAWTVWARKALGDNWSGRVTLKSGHELVRCASKSAGCLRSSVISTEFTRAPAGRLFPSSTELKRQCGRSDPESKPRTATSDR